MKVSNKICRKLVTFIIVAVVILLSGFNVVAQNKVPIQSYTYWENMSSVNSRKPVYTKALYQVSDILSAKDMNVEFFTELTDVFVDENTIYLLDGGASRLIVLDSNYKYKSEYTSFRLNDEIVHFEGARGVFAKDNLIYICDSENARVLVANNDGIIQYIMELPDSSLIPDDFTYIPIKAAVDSQGYTYILSEGSFYGLLLYSPDKEFMGFFAANDVTLNIGEALDKMIERIFPNNDKKAASERVLPYSMSDFCLDKEDFIYTSTGAADGSGGTKGQIKKLYQGNGENVLKTSEVNYLDEGKNIEDEYGKFLTQYISSIDVDDMGYTYCLDSAFCRIFVYDKKGSLLSAFGGGINNGTQEGTFQSVNALAINNSDIIVTDNVKNTVTIFETTELGKLVKNGRALSLRGEYAKTKEIWENVLKQDSNCQMAYSGLARAYLAENNFKEALRYSKLGYDRDTYALAYKEVRADFLDDNFFWLFGGLIFIIIAVAVFLIISTKKSIVLIKNEEIHLMSSVLFHPINTFTTIKEKRKGSLKISILLVVIFYMLTVMRAIFGGFLFTYYDVAEYNSLWTLAKSVGLVVLWIVANWLVCSLMGGNGRLKEITVVICYSLIPLIINLALQLLLTNVLLVDEAAFLNILNIVSYLIFFMMLAFGSMTIHDYGFGKFVATALLSVVGMAIVIFLIILIFILFQQFAGFVQTILMELRM
ncbi:MAG: YIP1 family protein [Acutalibacteraceae bacterium]|nr:YIP1 family protein [Acutalibacteraceae bacterium]